MLSNGCDVQLFLPCEQLGFPDRLIATPDPPLHPAESIALDAYIFIAVQSSERFGPSKLVPRPLVDTQYIYVSYGTGNREERGSLDRCYHA